MTRKTTLASTDKVPVENLDSPTRRAPLAYAAVNGLGSVKLPRAFDA